MPLHETSRLAEGLSLQKLLRQEVEEIAIHEEDATFNDVPLESRYYDMAYEVDDFIGHVNYDMIDLNELGDTAFETMASKMSDVTPDGKVKKLVVVPGNKEPIPAGAIVYVNYDFYLEMSEVPFDSSYLRLGKPEKLQVGCGNHFIGFDYAVRSMTCGEKAHFLIHFDYAFGKMGAAPRIPPEATIFAVISILEVVNCANASEEKELSEEDRKNYSAVGPQAEAEHNLATTYFKAKRIGTAVHHFLTEENLLLHCKGSNEKEEEERKARLLKTFTNLALCYNHSQLNDPSRAISKVDTAFNVVRESARRCAKLFYQRGVARVAKMEYTMALDDFKKALIIEPSNPEVVEKLLMLEKKITEAKKVEKEMSMKAFGGLSGKITAGGPSSESPEGNAVESSRPQSVKSEKSEAADDEPCSERDGKPEGGDLASTVSAYLNSFLRSPQSMANLSYGHTPAARRCYQEHCKRLGLVYEEHRKGPLRCEVIIKKKLV